LFIVADGKEVPPDKLQTMNLTQWRQPPADSVGVDVARGRISFGTNWAAAGQAGPGQVRASWFRGFPAELGGGGYDRQNRHLNRSQPELVVLTVGTGGNFATISAALSAIPAGTTNLLISIQDSTTYTEAISIEPADGGSVTIEAVDQHWPHLQGAISIIGDHPTATVTLSGLLLEGRVSVAGNLERLRLIHATLVPGLAIDAPPPSPIPPSLTAASPDTPLDCELIFSICGPIQIPAVDGSRLWLLDSIVDGVNGPAVSGPGGVDDAAPQAWIERSTLVGPSHFQQMLSATEALFTGAVTTDHRQQGCVRFSFVPDGSTTPRRYRCQPDLEIADEIAAATGNGPPLPPAQAQAIHGAVVSWLLPSFTDRRYGQPAYLQLHLHCVRQIRECAEDGSEVGAYCHLKQPQRLKNLQIRLLEYLPFSREAAAIFAT
jgi:hypothetical protein